VPGGWRDNDKVELTLQAWEPGTKPSGPVSRSQSNIIRIAMKKNAIECCNAITKALGDRAWESSGSNNLRHNPGLTRGVGGIFQKKEAKLEKEKTLSEVGLKDLNTLMQHAKELRNLARNTSDKIERKSNENNLDEAMKLRAMMMSLATVSKLL